MAVDPQFLKARPRRLLDWEEAPDGKVVVQRPRFGGGLGLRFSRWLGLNDYKIRLDEIGSLVWRSCDGKTEMARVAESLRLTFGDRVEPAEERLLEFTSSLHRARMIEF